MAKADNPGDSEQAYVLTWPVEAGSKAGFGGQDGEAAADAERAGGAGGGAGVPSRLRQARWVRL